MRVCMVWCGGLINSQLLCLSPCDQQFGENFCDPGLYFPWSKVMLWDIVCYAITNALDSSCFLCGRHYTMFDFMFLLLQYRHVSDWFWRGHFFAWDDLLHTFFKNHFCMHQVVISRFLCCLSCCWFPSGTSNLEKHVMVLWDLKSLFLVSLDWREIFFWYYNL
jgi:hypothetical protein